MTTSHIKSLRDRYNYWQNLEDPELTYRDAQDAARVVVDLCDYILKTNPPEVSLDSEFAMMDDFLAGFGAHAEQANELFYKAFPTMESFEADIK